MAKRTAYQERVIRNYYQNIDAIAVQRLGEMVTDLYLAEGKARERVWKRIVPALQKAGVPQDRIDHIVQSDNPALLASLVQELLAK
jgi:predicted metal-dependent phosphotriesterase family hydrolase